MAGINVNALVLRQKTHELYVFTMASDTLNGITYVTPRSHDDPNEIQRILKMRHSRRDRYLHRSRPTTLLPTAIVVSLDNEVSVTPTGDSNVRVLEFPVEAEGKFAYVLDGQHRLESVSGA